MKVYKGSMFAGKSEEAIRILNLAKFACIAGAKRRSLAIKPAADKLYGASIGTKRVVNGKSTVTEKWPAVLVETEEDFWRALEDAGDIQLLVVDEAQFFDPWLYGAICRLLNKRANDDFEILVFGLDLDSEQQPFGPMPVLMALADEVIKLRAICFRCGESAGLTKRKNDSSDEQVQLGASELYEALCLVCYQKD